MLDVGVWKSVLLCILVLHRKRFTSTRWQHLPIYGIQEAVRSERMTTRTKSNCTEDIFAVKSGPTLIESVTFNFHYRKQSSCTGQYLINPSGLLVLFVCSFPPPMCGPLMFSRQTSLDRAAQHPFSGFNKHAQQSEITQRELNMSPDSTHNGKKTNKQTKEKQQKRKFCLKPRSDMKEKQAQRQLVHNAQLTLRNCRILESN